MPDDRGPKYVAHLHPDVSINMLLGAGDTLVIVEDFMSAAKVGDVTACMPLFTTSLNTAQLVRCMDYKKFVVWLDNDNPIVINSAMKIKRRLEMFGETHVIMDKKDPKHYTVFEIDEILRGL
jgi:hypothetical protein